LAGQRRAGSEPIRQTFTVPNKGPSFYGRTAISRTLFEVDAAHVNFEINTDDPSCESYIAEYHSDTF
jgi:hypothetical protein